MTEEPAALPTVLWSPSRVAEEATRRIGRTVGAKAVLESIDRGELPAITVQSRSDSPRPVATYGIRPEDAEAWTPRPKGHPTAEEMDRWNMRGRMRRKGLREEARRAQAS